MIGAEESGCTPTFGKGYSFEIVSRPSEIKKLAASVSHLTGSNGARSNPGFFLANLWDHWNPRVVIFRHRGQIVGIVYAKARTVFGIPTGIVYIDSGLSSSIFAGDDKPGNVLSLACNALLSQTWVRGLRLTLLAGSPELHAMRADLACQGLDYDEDDLTRHRVLRLAPTYEGFLASIGLKTRRHIRYYRRRVEADGHRYVEGLTPAEFVKTASELMHEEVTGANTDMVKRAAAVAGSADDPLLVGLRAQNGAWLSVLAGWHEGGRAFVLWQVNSDKRHAHYSPSVVLRSYVIESLIARGVTELVFWGSLEGRLKPHTVPVPSVYLYIDKPDFLWKTVRLLMRRFGHRLPSRIKDSFCWVVRPSKDWARPEDSLATNSAESVTEV